MSKDEKSIYDLKLFEEIDIDCNYATTHIQRVPGGWIEKITKWDYVNDQIGAVFMCHIPYSDEFRNMWQCSDTFCSKYNLSHFNYCPQCGTKRTEVNK